MAVKKQKRISPALRDIHYNELLESLPNLAIQPWGATEAHNNHLPYGSDYLQAEAISCRAAEKANLLGARSVVLPPVPYGNNAQQLDQISTIHISTTTALAILRDVSFSLKRQGIDKLLLVNTHGGNNFIPLIRDLILETGMLIVLVNVHEMIPEFVAENFEKHGDHAGELETSMMLYLTPELVNMEDAGPGKRIPFKIKGLSKKGVWTPRPWRASHPDLGSGDPSLASFEKGEKYVSRIIEELSEVILELSQAKKGDLPYV